MNKHSEPLFQKSNFSPPGMINFSNIFIASPKTFQFAIRSRGERNSWQDRDKVGKVSISEILTLSALSRSCQFLPLSDRTTCSCL